MSTPIDEALLEKLVGSTLDRLSGTLKSLKMEKRKTPIVSTIIPAAVYACDVHKRDVPPACRHGAGLATVIGIVVNESLVRLGLSLVMTSKLDEDVAKTDKLQHGAANIDISFNTRVVKDDEKSTSRSDDIEKIVEEAFLDEEFD